MKMRVLSAFGTVAILMGASLPASAQTAETPVLPDETISGVPSQSLPTPPVLTAKFTLPMDIQVAKDPGITTNTPLTDQYGSDLAKWGESVSECLKSKPVLLRVVGDESVPFVVGGSEGRLKLNANDKAVCSL